MRNEILLQQGRLIDKKYLDLVRNSPFEPKSSRIIIKVDGVKHKRHPVYDLYAASEGGKIINVVKQKALIGNFKNNNHMNYMVRG